MQVIPKWLQKHIDSSGLEQIEQAIHQAELKTSGEIVPVVIRKCSTVGHIALPLLLLNFISIQILFEVFGTSFDHSISFAISLVSALIVTRLLSPLDFIERCLTPKEDQSRQVIQRAELEFYESNIQQTADSTGILIFISLMERKVVVLADKAINDQLPKETWQHVVDLVIKGIKSKNMASGLKEAVKFVGTTLEGPLPIKPNDNNELSNHLVIKEY